MSNIKQQGVVLIVVLWIVVLLTILLAAFTATVKVDRHVATDVLESVQARASADGVLNYLTALRTANPEVWLEMPGQVYKLGLNNVQVRFRLIPETAFISLNSASVNLLQTVFESAKIPDAQEIAELIVQRRSDSMNESTGEAATPKVLTSVLELSQLSQLNTEQLQVIQHWFTVDSEHEGVNLLFSEPSLIHALLQSEAEELLAARAEGNEFEIDTLSTAFMQREQGDIVRVQVELSTSASKRKIEATVAFDDGERGYHVVRWNEYNAHFSLE